MTDSPSSKPTANGEVNLYAPENVVAYLRSIESNSIAGIQFRRAADRIERLERCIQSIREACDSENEPDLTVSNIRERLHDIRYLP